MSEKTPVSIAEILRGLDPERVQRVPPDRVAELASSSLPSVVEGMLYVRSEEFLTEVYGPKGKLLKIGLNEEGVSGTYLLAETGAVVHVESGDTTERFVNSSLSSFLTFLAEWHSFISASAPRRDGDIDEDRIIAIGKKLRTSLKKIDKAAFSDEDNWWSLVFEEVELGILGPEE